MILPSPAASRSVALRDKCYVRRAAHLGQLVVLDRDDGRAYAVTQPCVRRGATASAGGPDEFTFPGWNGAA